MEIFSALLAFVRGIHRSPVNPRTKSSDAELWCFFYLRLNRRLSKKSWVWWFETPSCSLWRHCNVIIVLWSSYFVLFLPVCIMLRTMFMNHPLIFKLFHPSTNIGNAARKPTQYLVNLNIAEFNISYFGVLFCLVDKPRRVVCQWAFYVCYYYDKIWINVLLTMSGIANKT